MVFGKQFSLGERFDVVCEVTLNRSGLTKAIRLRPAVVVLDVFKPDRGGLQFVTVPSRTVCNPGAAQISPLLFAKLWMPGGSVPRNSPPLFARNGRLARSRPVDERSPIVDVRLRRKLLGCS